MSKKQEPTETPKKRGRPAMENPREAITLRLDPQVLAYFRESYDSTVGAAINHVLMEHVKRAKRREVAA